MANLDPSQFEFKKGQSGPFSMQFRERMESLRRAVVRASPSDGSHVGIRILKSESGGWTAVVPRSLGGAAADFSFQVVQTAAGTVKVRHGTVNSIAPPQVNPDINEATAFAGSPAQLWLNVTRAEGGGAVTAVSIVTEDPGDETIEMAKLLVAAISWADDVAIIAQNVTGSQQLASCGTNHFFNKV